MLYSVKMSDMGTVSPALTVRLKTLDIFLLLPLRKSCSMVYVPALLNFKVVSTKARRFDESPQSVAFLYVEPLAIVTLGGTCFFAHLAYSVMLTYTSLPSADMESALLRYHPANTNFF